MTQKFSIESGVLLGAIQLASPNFNHRPESASIELLVIHNISLPPKQFGGGFVEQFFLNKLDCSADPFFAEISALQVSAHVFISRKGEVTQFVNFTQRAWHAGISSFNQRQNCNDFSIGIELEGTDDQDFEDIQYQVLAAISKVLQQTYQGIGSETVVGHSEIAPGRKTDPGGCFDWPKYRALWCGVDD
ncbi:MAG: protein AmpD [Osedax symbiont Rs1]|nr:MAG: protein AmpD [Osedax symbiont Rs1]